jgi:ubiquitin carboxyl-terminal hydrolase 34
MLSLQVEVVSEEDEEEDVIPLPTDKYKPASLEKMITLVASLVERSRGPDHLLQLSTQDFNAIAGGKASSVAFCFAALLLQVSNVIMQDIL